VLNLHLGLASDGFSKFFLRKMLGTRYEPAGTDFSDSRDLMIPNQVPKTPFNTLASGQNQGFLRKKNTETNVALRGNFSGPVSATDPVKSSKYATSLVACT